MKAEINGDGSRTRIYTYDDVVGLMKRAEAAGISFAPGSWVEGLTVEQIEGYLDGKAQA